MKGFDKETHGVERGEGSHFDLREWQRGGQLALVDPVLPVLGTRRPNADGSTWSSSIELLSRFPHRSNASSRAGVADRRVRALGAETCFAGANVVPRGVREPRGGTAQSASS